MQNLITLGIASINMNTLELKSWTKIEKTLGFSSIINAKVSLNLVYSDFTKNPNKIVNFMFHRLILLPENEIRK